MSEPNKEYDYEIIILEKENKGIIKIKNTEFVDYPLHFFIQAGVLEAKTNSIFVFKIDVQVYGINNKENYCIIIINLHPN